MVLLVNYYLLFNFILNTDILHTEAFFVHFFLFFAAQKRLVAVHRHHPQATRPILVPILLSSRGPQLYAEGETQRRYPDQRAGRHKRRIFLYFFT